MQMEGKSNYLPLTAAEITQLLGKKGLTAGVIIEGAAGFFFYLLSAAEETIWGGSWVSRRNCTRKQLNVIVNPLPRNLCSA